jgi:6-phosphogluconate dehydrogenase
MSQTLDSFGIVGLGKMGAGMAKNALANHFGVAGLDTRPISDDLTRAGLKPAAELKDFAKLLKPPRFVILYVPAGPPVDAVLDELAGVHARLKQTGIHLIDAGTSGGPGGALEGACFMVGGEREPVALVEPMLRKLAVEGGYIHCGGPGAGHFVKLVHNGIEFGMLQAIGEGIDLLAHYREPLAIADILENWRHGSVVRSWLIELMEQTYRQQGGLVKVPPYVEDTGEVNWLVNDALHMEVPIPVITQSVVQLVASRDPDRDAARAVAMMRHGFGGHPYGPAEGIAHERHTGRVGGFIGNGKA